MIYTAHYDHLGMREPKPGDPPDVDRIYNGAIDNASGLSGVLEIAQALGRARRRPARSIYIMFTTAEESGLLGAEYFAAHPVLPAEAWAANINIDSLNMAGPRRDIVLLGAERSTLGGMAAALAAERGRVVGPDPEPGRGYFFRSDHFPLAKVGIPALSLSEPTRVRRQGSGVCEEASRRVQREGLPPAERRDAGRLGLQRAPWTTCASSRSSDGASRTRRTCPRTTRTNSSPVRGRTRRIDSRSSRSTTSARLRSGSAVRRRARRLLVHIRRSRGGPSGPPLL